MVTFDSSTKVYEILKQHYNAHAEEFWGVFLNHQLQIVKLKLIHRGSVNYCRVHPRDLFREALHANAYVIIIAHNHTSTNVQPSQEDITITKKLKRISKLVEIPIIDHIVFNHDDYFSFKENYLI